MVRILEKPAALSFSGNLTKFLVESDQPFAFSLKKKNAASSIFEHTYYPGTDKRSRIDVSNIIEDYLYFSLQANTNVHLQPNIKGVFVAVIDTQTVEFEVIRGGISNLEDTTTNWLKHNFLTWQPIEKNVTYHSPEWISWYAISACALMLDATFEDQSRKSIKIADCQPGNVYTANLQYGYISGLLGKLPSYYDVYLLYTDSQKSQVQRYLASDPKSEDEIYVGWENSLGGYDVARMSGYSTYENEGKHEIGSNGDSLEEYNTELSKKHVCNTGLMTLNERFWFVDFFISKRRHVYIDNAMREIVLSEDKGSIDTAETIDGLSFTFREKEDSKYLNVPRLRELPSDITIPAPSLPDFNLPPRLVEYARITLDEGVLIPAQHPNSQTCGVTTWGAMSTIINKWITDAIAGIKFPDIPDIPETLPPGPHTHQINDVVQLKTELEKRLLKSDVLASTDAETVLTEENVYSAIRSLLEDQKRLRRDIPDTAEGLIKFLQGAHFGEYVNSMAAGKGAGIDANGNAQFESVEVRGYMKVMELIINRLSAIESDYVFTDSGNCLAVEDLGERTYRLTMRKDYDFDFTSLKEDDIVYSIVNNLLSSGEYYTVWMRVLSVNINANTLTVVLFPDVECPTGKNFPPIPSINIARRGSVSDKMRQSCFYLSSSEGAIVFLDGVTKPILEEYNYQMILGKPKHLSIFDNLPINFDHTYLYVRGLIFQDSFHVRHNGVPVRSEVFRGEWSAVVAASEDPYRYTTTEVHLVYHLGCKWSCYTDKTVEEPKWNATGWVMIEGNNNLSVEFTSSNGFSFVRGRVDTEITPICKLGHIDISDDILAADWEWKRDSGLPVEDTNWNIAHAANGRMLHLTNDDMPSNWSITNKVKFSCSAFVRVGSEVYKVENQIIA